MTEGGMFPVSHSQGREIITALNRLAEETRNLRETMGVLMSIEVMRATKEGYPVQELMKKITEDLEAQREDT